MAVTTPILKILVLDTHNLSTFAVADSSVYPSGFTIVSPSIQIIAPSFPVITLPFTPSSLNLYTSNDLGITCNPGQPWGCDIPDGYWDLTYTISPAQTYFSEVGYMKTDLLQKKMQEGFLALDLNHCDQTIKDQDMRELDEINYYIQCSISAGNKCNPKLALDLYAIAWRMLQRFLGKRVYGYNDTVWE